MGLLTAWRRRRSRTIPVQGADRERDWNQSGGPVYSTDADSEEARHAKEAGYQTEYDPLTHAILIAGIESRADWNALTTTLHPIAFIFDPHSDDPFCTTIDGHPTGQWWRRGESHRREPGQAEPTDDPTRERWWQ